MSLSVTVFGATGAQGDPVVREALARGHTVRGVARDAARVAERHPGVQAATADLDDAATVARALESADAAFAHLPMPSSPGDPARWLEGLLHGAHLASLPLLVFTTSGPAAAAYPASAMIDGARAAAAAVLGSEIPTIVLQPALYLENLAVPLFVPRLSGEGVLDYPPLPTARRIAWTSHRTQARLAVAAFERPELAGRAFDTVTPNPVDGHELARLLGRKLGKDVRHEPLSPSAFGDRVGEALGNPGVAHALTDLYGALLAAPADAMDIDARALEREFGVSLESVARIIEGWPD